MKPKLRQQSLQQIFQTQIDYLATLLTPQTLHNYHITVRNFLRYLASDYPGIHTLHQLRRDPHILSWMYHLAARSTIRKATRRWYLLCLRRLLNDLAHSGKYALREGLIIQTDIPRPDHYLPRPLSPKDDQLLQQYLRAQDNLSSNALLLLRYTGMRIGEFMRLPTDSLRHIGGDQWALHVPLGKLRTERWIPADAQFRQLHARLLLLREETALACRCNLLLPYRGHDAACQALRKELRNAAQQAGCPRGVTPHRLRHTFATEMLRAGTSLPALMHLLGHNHLNMTLRYVQVTQDDLQHEYHNARKSMVAIHAIPELHRTPSSNEPAADLNGILKSMTAMHHLVEMFRRALTDEQSRRKTARLTKRLVNITTEFRKFIPTQK